MIVCRTARTSYPRMFLKNLSQKSLFFSSSILSSICPYDALSEVNCGMTGKLIHALALGLALSSFAAAADQGQYRYQQDIGSWASAVYHANNTDTPQVWSASLSYSDTFFLVEVPNTSVYRAMVSVTKKGSQIGNVLSSREVELNCELRVDTYPVFYIRCSFSDDNEGAYLSFGAGLGERFLDQLKAGNTLRIKVDLGQSPMYDRYSLRGFSRAFSRALSLLGSGSGYGSGYVSGNDSDYFR